MSLKEEDTDDTDDRCGKCGEPRNKLGFCQNVCDKEDSGEVHVVEANEDNEIVSNFIITGISMLGSLIELKGKEEGKDSYNPCQNNGSSFVCNAFSMEAYCWCDGDTKGHEEGCPDNFYCSETGANASWYKHIGRGTEFDPKDYSVWAKTFEICLRGVLNSGKIQPGAEGEKKEDISG